MEDCLFCKIIAGEIPSAKVYEDETVYVFKDINPITPIHYLLIPKQHICCAAKITPENSAVTKWLQKSQSRRVSRMAIGS